MKTIKDAVIELDGKWPKEFALGYMSYDGYRLYYDATGYQVCVNEQFEAEAKRLGYINGYEWGKEYPTNGKRPELADDVLVAYQHETMGGLCFDSDRVEDVGWLSVVSFKVTDPRYKPVDTSYLNTPTQTQSLTHSEWYNYEEKRPHVAGILPPIGSEVIYKVWNKDTVSDENAKRDGCILDVVAHHDGLIVGVSKDLYFSTCCNSTWVLPVDHATRTAELHREKVIEAAVDYLAGYEKIKDIAAHLYDAGMLVLTGTNCNTKS